VYPEYQQLLSVVRDSEFILCGTKVLINKMVNTEEGRYRYCREAELPVKEKYKCLCVNI